MPTVKGFSNAKPLKLLNETVIVLVLLANGDSGHFIAVKCLWNGTPRKTSVGVNPCHKNQAAATVNMESKV